MKKILSLILALVLIFTLVACSTGGNEPAESGNESTGAASGPIHVVSREDGSGTRGAFVEIVGVIDDNDNDLTVQSATIQDGTGKVIETVVADSTAIGYVSLGSVDGSGLKALSVNGVEANAENVLSGDYPIQRPLNIAYVDGSLSPLAQDFVNFLMSAEGQKIAVDEGFVEAAPDAEAYTAGEFEPGTLSISGSTSVGPLMTVAAEAYEALHEGVTIEINESGSSAGVKDAMDQVVDLGMASRELKEDEAAVVKSLAIAKDGIAVVIAPENPINDISLDSVKGIYLGEILDWSEVK